MFARLKNLDDRIFDNITRIHRPVVNKIMVGASKLGNAGIVWWFVIILFLIVPAWRFSGLVVIFAIGLTSLMGEGIIKHAVKRIRPCTELDEALAFARAREARDLAGIWRHRHLAPQVARFEMALKLTPDPLFKLALGRR